MFAFAIESFYGGRKELADPNFVSWQPMIVESDGNVNEEVTLLEFRKCE